MIIAGLLSRVHHNITDISANNDVAIKSLCLFWIFSVEHSRIIVCMQIPFNIWDNKSKICRVDSYTDGPKHVTYFWYIFTMSLLMIYLNFVLFIAIFDCFMQIISSIHRPLMNNTTVNIKTALEKTRAWLLVPGSEGLCLLSWSLLVFLYS